MVETFADHLFALFELPDGEGRVLKGGFAVAPAEGFFPNEQTEAVGAAAYTGQARYDALSSRGAQSGGLILTAYAAEDPPAVQWAKEITAIYDNAPAMKGVRTLAEQLGTDALVDYQNRLVSLKGMTVEPYDEEGSAFQYKDPDGKTDDLYFKVSKDGKTFEFCVEFYLCGNDTPVYKAVEALEVGQVVDLEGFLYWYEGANLHTTGLAVVE